MIERFLAGAAMVLAASAGVQAQEAPAVKTAAQELSREQVLEDLKQWHASGMTFVAHPTGYSDAAHSLEYQRYLQQSRATAQVETASASAAQTAASESPAKHP